MILSIFQKKNGSEEQQRKSSDMDKLRYIYLIQY